MSKEIRPIDANALIESIVVNCRITGEDNAHAVEAAFNSLLDQIRSAPTLDMTAREEYAYECGYEHFYHECQKCEHRKADTYGTWIPCEERLPEKEEVVLVCYKTTDTVHLCKYIGNGEVGEGSNDWWSYIDDCCAWNNVVLAWMPLPAPYTEESSTVEQTCETCKHYNVVSVACDRCDKRTHSRYERSDG